MRRVPIRLRVAAAFALAMALVLAATSWYLYARLDSHLGAALDRNLSVRAQDLAVLVRQPGASLAKDSGSRFVERGESYAQLVDAHGRVLEASRPLGTSSLLTRGELARALQRRIFVERPSVPGLDESSRLLATPLVRRGQRLVLVVGVTRADQTETLANLREELLIAGPIALAIASLAGYALAGLSLRPVESMRRRAAEISAETAGERLPVPRTGDEVERLGRTLNEMLARLDSTLERQRTFVADAGHELRTPLALLRTELELALRHDGSSEGLREAVRASSVEVERLAQLADDLLLIAHSERGQLPLRLETLDAPALLSSIAGRFEWRAREEGRSVRAVPGAAVQLRGDRIRLEQALGNLIDNALRHGGGEVRLSASSSGDLVQLHVSDDGDGFPTDFQTRAFERFARADQARGRGGTGLGLSIVRVIAEAHGGSAQLANRDGGGAEVWIELPAPDAEPPGA